MNRYLLDTNFVSELRKNKPHGAVLEWFSGLQETQISLSAVTLGELQAGVEVTRRQNVAKAEQIEQWLESLAESYLILPMDAVCFREWARLMNGKPDRLVVASRNERDFTQLTVQIFNPFTSELVQPSRILSRTRGFCCAKLSPTPDAHVCRH